MGRNTFTQRDYNVVRQSLPSSRVTSAAEEETRRTGKLNPLIDPAGGGVIRRSLPRVKKRADGLWELTVGTPYPLEDRGDTTGSMGDNVDIMLDVLPTSYDLCSRMLPGCDTQMLFGIFGDCEDPHVMCRGEFEMEAEKLVKELGLMVPYRAGGGNGGEDPHYGLFGAAFLTATYLEAIGLKGYDFTISDEPARYALSASQLIRVYGREVFDRLAENGYAEIDRRNLPTTQEVVKALLKRAHAFFLEVPGHPYYPTHGFWTEIFGAERVVVLPSVSLVPHIKATIIGLTEGTLGLEQVIDFLRENKLSRRDAEEVLVAVSHIPVGAQAALPSFGRRPKQGDLFADKPDIKAKTNLWPIGADQTPPETETEAKPPKQRPSGGPDWL